MSNHMVSRHARDCMNLTALFFALTAVPAAAAENDFPVLRSGTIDLELTAIAKTAGKRYSHAGWDFFAGPQKLFYVGAGWKSGDRSKWGLWDAVGNRSVFHFPIRTGQRDKLLLRIDFGTEKPGDERVDLWVNAAEIPKREPDASLDNLRIPVVDAAKLFSSDDYEFSAPVVRTVSKSKRTSDVPAMKGGQLFTQRIRPLLEQKCGACHGETAQEIEGGFDLRTRETLVRGGDSGEPGIDPKNLESSSLLRAIRWQDGLEMPPKENDRLNAEQIGWIEEWIRDGAKWSEVSLGDSGWTDPVADGGVRVRTSGGLSDSWTYRTYQQNDLWAYQPIKSVDIPWKALPDSAMRHPIDAFIARRLDAAGLAAAPRVDDRTLKRRISYSLTGLPPDHDDLQNVDAYIDALLHSPHYGERMAQHWLDVVRYADSNGFARDDMRPDAHRYRTYVIQSFNDDKPFDHFVREQIAGDELQIADQDALSFLWMGPWEHTAMSVAAVTRQQWLDDVTNSVGVTFLGQQLRCAKCHDHKFDPIPTRDYYSFQAVFAATRHNEKQGTFRIQKQRPEQIAILQGGALDSPGESVTPAALSMLADTANHTFAQSEQQKSRAALAEWIASSDNPLTARVIVNRVWQMHFGRGIVATPNDFGKMGADPTHPELLKWLAHWFIENDWSIKKLHRLVLTSSTFQQSTQHPAPERVAEADPANELLSYFPARRLTAEEIRDSMLAISGELNPEVGGPSVYVEINWEVAFQPLRKMGDIAPPYQPSSKRADRNRRSIYAVRIRNIGHPLMEVFNRPGTEMSCDRRDETTVTPQVFTLLHGEFSHERALALAARISEQNDAEENRIKRLFQAVYGRPPTAEEHRQAIQYLTAMIELHRSHRLQPEQLPTTLTVENVVEKTGERKEKTFPLKNLANYENDLKPWDVDPETRALADLGLVLFNSSEFLYVY